MTTDRRFERQLPVLLEDLYLGPTPDYRDEVLAVAVRSRQRPAWTFTGRWIPMADIASRPSIMPRIPLRSLVVGLVIIAMLLAGLAVYIGSRRTTVPPPFGIARNGLIAYAAGGDIYAADSITGTTTPVVTGSQTDRCPTFSRDGTRIAFLRHVGDSGADAFDLLVAKADGTELKVLTTTKLHGNAPFEWSADGTFVVATTGNAQVIRYDSTGATGPVVIAQAAHVQAGAFRPPDGAQILYQPDTPSRHALYVMNADGSGARPLLEIPAAEASDSDFGAVRWSPDGTLIAFLRAPVGATDQLRIWTMRADGTGVRQLSTETGAWFETDLVWSPDGKRIAFDRYQQNPKTLAWEIRPLGIISVDGGPVLPVGPTPVSDGAWFDWSPDGATIVSIPGTILGWPKPAVVSARPLVIDASTGLSHELDWTVDSAPSWQRLAR